MIPGIDVFSTSGDKYGSLSSESKGSVLSDVGETAEAALGREGGLKTVIMAQGEGGWWLNTFENTGACVIVIMSVTWVGFGTGGAVFLHPVRRCRSHVFVLLPNEAEVRLTSI